MRAPLIILIAIGLLAAPAAAHACDRGPIDPADQPPFGGAEVARASAPVSGDQAVPGFTLNPDEAASLATDAVGNDGRTVVRTLSKGRTQWRVDFFDSDGEHTAQVLIDDGGACVIEAWTGSAVDTKLARGYEGAVSGKVNKWWIWLPLCLLFVAPFIDPRRPFRLLHLDLLALLGFSASLFFFNKAEIGLSVALVYPVLAYVFIRMLIAGFWPKDRDEPLLPFAKPSWLVAGIVALVVFHTAYMADEGKVIDVGLAGVIGADRLTHGEDIYNEDFSEGLPSSGDVRGDVYGPVNYLSYVPFEQAFPWSGSWDDVPAARSAALGFELLTAIALFLLGRRLRDGPEGNTLGVALAYAWLAYPFTMYSLGSSFNDGWSRSSSSAASS